MFERLMCVGDPGPNRVGVEKVELLAARPDDLRALAHRVGRQVVADEPGGACDQHPHARRRLRAKLRSLA